MLKSYGVGKFINIFNKLKKIYLILIILFYIKKIREIKIFI